MWDVVIHIFSSLLHTESGGTYRDPGSYLDAGLQSILVGGERKKRTDLLLEKQKQHKTKIKSVAVAMVIVF